ncbi:GNAT family N-acetyltransferase [Lachnospiraceae bacterium 62-35]
MVRKLEEKDMDPVMEIWLEANILAHDFVPKSYWRDKLQEVREMISQAEVYVYENPNFGTIQGFVGMSGDYIAGIFVCEEARSRGIGRQLLDYVKAFKLRLTLRVYEKNQRAVRFYERESFQIQSEHMDKDTGEKEYFMIWP